MTNFSKIILSLTLGTAASMGQSLESVSITSLAAAAVTTPAGVASSRAVEPDTRRRSRTYQWSVVALGAATTADVASSWKFSHDGQKEANSFLQSGNGGYGMKGAAIEVGLVGGSLLMQHYLVKRHPGLRVPFSIANYAMAGFQVFNVRHNLSY